MSASWNIDSQVPEPSGLYPYIQALDSWVKGAPLEDPMLGGLIQACSFGDAARRDFKSGRGALWSLVPPIDALQIQEAKLDLVGLRALTVPLVLQGRHALHHFLPEQPQGIPEVLVDLEYLCGLLLSSLEQGGDSPGSAAQRRVELLLEALESRSSTELGIDDSAGVLFIPKRRAAPRKKERSSAPASEPRTRQLDLEEPTEELSTEELIQRRARAARRSASFSRALVGLLVIPLLVGLYFVLPEPGGGLPAVTTYSSMPLVGLVRKPGQVKARVHASWFVLPEDERDIAVMILWDELVDETEDPGLELMVADHVNKTRGGVVAGKVWWRLY